MDKLSIAIISASVGKTPEYIPSSFVFDEAYRLAIKGINVHIIRNKIEKGSLSYGIHFHGIERKINFGTILLMLRKLPLYSKISFLSTRVYSSNVSKVIESNGIDLIHAHFAHYEGLVGLLTKRVTGKPLIVTVHGYDILVEPSVGYGVRLSKRMDSIVRRVLNGADAVIAASKSAFNEASKIVNDVDKIYLIPNGVDLQKFNPGLDGQQIRKKYALDRKYRYIILSLATHEPAYGVEYLIRAIPLITRKVKDVFFIVGGNGSLRKYHEQLAHELGVIQNVLFTGSIPRDKVSAFYAISDVIAVPLLQAGFSLVVTESMASGKPVVASEVGGIPDQIIDKYNGFLVKPRNAEAIAEKILFLYENPERALEMGRNGRKIAEEKFNIEKRVERIIDLYKKLCERTPKSS